MSLFLRLYLLVAVILAMFGILAWVPLLKISWRYWMGS